MPGPPRRRKASMIIPGLEGGMGLFPRRRGPETLGRRDRSVSSPINPRSISSLIRVCADVGCVLRAACSLRGAEGEHDQILTSDTRRSRTRQEELRILVSQSTSIAPDLS